MSFGTMVSTILNDINRGSQHASRVKQAIVDAISRYQTKRLGWNQNRQETSIIRGDEYLALPSEWIEVDLVRLQDGSRRRKLDEVGYEWMEDNLRDDTYFGLPTKFAIENRRLRLYPIPDRSYSLMMIFQLELPEISLSASDDATNAWMEEGELLIRTHAQGDVMVRYIQGDSIPLGQQLVSFAETMLLPQLELQASREQASGRLRAHL